MRTERRHALAREGTWTAVPARTERVDAGVPPFTEAVVIVPLLACLGFALVAVPLAMVAAFEPLPVAAGTIAAAAALYSLWWVRGRDAALVRFGGRFRWATVAVLVFVAAVSAMNLAYSAEHVITNRDPGGYVNTAVWLRDHGGLLVDAKVGPFAGRDDLTFPAGAFYDADRPDGALYPQFVHLLPAFLAAFGWIGGTSLLVSANAIAGAVALLAFYGFASRLLRPWLAFLATVALALNLVQLHFTRDAYSEILTQVFLFGGLWALWHARTHLDARRAFVAGLLLGATAMTRVDAFLFLVPVAAYLALGVARSVDWPLGRRLAYRLFLAAAGLGTVVTSSLALLDGLRYSPIYLRHLGDELWQIAALLAATVALGAAAVVDHDRLRRLGRWMYARRVALGGAVALAVLVAALVSGVVRPFVSHPTGEHNGIVEEAQVRTGLEVEPSRTYAELTMHWLSWYLGPLALAAGVVAWAASARDAIIRRREELAPFLIAFSVMTAVYLWRPSITPDHIWAMRRMLSVTIPGLILLAYLAVQWLLDRPRTTGTVWTASAAVVLAASTLAVQVAISAPWIDQRSYPNLIEPTEELCEAVTPDGAVLFSRGVGLHWMQTVRGFCGVPAAQVSDDVSEQAYVELARSWSQLGRRLVVLSERRDPVEGAGWESRRVVTYEIRRPERTLDRRPAAVHVEQREIYLTPVPL